MDFSQTPQGVPPPGPEPSVAPAAASPAVVHVHIRRNAPAVIIMVFIAGFFFLTSALLALALLAVAAVKAVPQETSSKPAAPFIEKTVGGDRDAEDRLLLASVEGLMTNAPRERLLSEEPGMADRISEMFAQARRDARVKAVLLRINTPGGSITTADVVHERILAFRKETSRKVVALLDDVAASGGYYVASAADRIVAHPTTLTGSIGVIMPLMSFKGLMEKIGVKAQPVKSRPFKDIGAFYTELSDDERAVLQKMVDELYHRFVAVVQDGASRRGVRDLTRQKILAISDGRIFTGEQALANGLVDELGYYDTAVGVTLKLAGLQKARIVRYAPRPKGILEMLQTTADSSASRDITLRLEGLPAPVSWSPMYLWCPGAPVFVGSDSGL